MAAYNRVRPELAQGNIWFAVTEPERVCIMRLENGAWRSIHCRSLATDNPLVALVTVLEREQQLAGLDPQTDTIVLYAPGVSSASLATITKTKFKLVGPSSESSLDWHTDSQFAMAVSA
jgi:hypothetical protein